jgi:hypothetical protein
VSVTTHVLYYECGCVILLIRYESSIGILLQYVRIVCMYVVCVSSVTMESMCSCLSFFVPSEIWFSGGEHI